jgi:hypothetical protein
MNETRWERWGATSGFAALLVGAAAIIFERGALSASDPLTKIAAHYAENRPALLAQALLFVIGAGFFVWFVGSLRTFLARAEGGSGRLSLVAFGAGVGSTMVTLVALAFQIGLATAPTNAGQPALVATTNALYTVANLPLAVMLTAMVVLSFRTKVFPAWLAWLSLASAAAQLLPVFGIVLTTGPLADGGWLAAFVPYPLHAVWLASTTVVMVTRLGKSSPAPVIPRTARELVGSRP